MLVSESSYAAMNQQERDLNDSRLNSSYHMPDSSAASSSVVSSFDTESSSSKESSKGSVDESEFSLEDSYDEEVANIHELENELEQAK